jgi:site-specific recombinase XerD
MDEFFEDLQVQDRLRQGPLGDFVVGFAGWLAERQYTEATVRAKLQFVAALSRWLEHRRLSVAKLDEPSIERFVRQRWPNGRATRGAAATLRALLDYLRQLGVLPSPAPPAEEQSELARFEHRFTAYLVRERGLTQATVDNSVPFARGLLAERFGTGQIHPDQIKPVDITRFVGRHAHALSPGRAKLMVTALRSFFRFLLQHGEIEVDLAAAVPSVADWRLSTVPRFIRPDQVQRLLDTCARSTAVGRRDYAVLLLLSRLGLRAGEVVALELDHIDWRAGEVVVPGKGLVHDRLPLPTDVGEALADHLRRDRPECLTRRVFLCMRAPRRGFAGPSTVCTIVRRALEKAGISAPVKGAHLLRHSLATGMINAGASMAEIGQVLRHRSSATTEIYAKVDVTGLRSLAQPWPLSGGSP